MNAPGTQELYRPPPNRLVWKGGLLQRLKTAARIYADVQVFTVRRDVEPWLRGRRGSLLEVGCGDQPYREFVPANCRYVGLDIDAAFDGGAHDVVRFDGRRFPFADASFESVFHTEVLEHVYDTRAFLAECRRVLALGGEMVFSVPFQARYHYIPNDFYRFTPAALELLMAEAGFRDIRVQPRGSDITVASYKCISVFYRWALSSILGKALFPLTLPLVLLLLAIAYLSLWFSLGSSNDCLGYTVAATRCEREGLSG